MNQIDHNPNEPKIDRQNYGWLYRRALVVVGGVWLLHWYSGDATDWMQIGLGAFTASILTLVLVDYSRANE